MISACRRVELGMGDEERETLRAQGIDPDSSTVVAAISLVLWEESLLNWRP
jgi:hypothetical protein